MEDIDHPDWAPSQKLGHNKVTRKSGLRYSHLKRIQEREKKGEAAAATVTVYQRTSKKGAPQAAQVKKCDRPTHIHGQQDEEGMCVGQAFFGSLRQSDWPVIQHKGMSDRNACFGNNWLSD